MSVPAGVRSHSRVSVPVLFSARWQLRLFCSAFSEKEALQNSYPDSFCLGEAFAHLIIILSRCTQRHIDDWAPHLRRARYQLPLAMYCSSKDLLEIPLDFADDRLQAPDCLQGATQFETKGALRLNLGDALLLGVRAFLKEIVVYSVEVLTITSQIEFFVICAADSKLN